MNIVYNASAGTGKTHQVTGLYERLVLEDGIDPRRILLMTFTENAAAELRMRVAHRLLKVRRAAETAGDDMLADRAMEAMSHLPSAPIGTIHSFCTRLLREHALEAGLSPGFSVLAGDEGKDMLDRICRDELLARLDTDPDFKTFCSGVQPIGSGGFGTSVTETVPALIAQAGSLGISLENAEAMLPDPLPPASRIDFEHICKRIEELPNITSTVQVALDTIRQAMEETETVEELVDRMNELDIKKFGRGGAKAVSDDFWALKTSVEDAVRYSRRHPAAKAFARYVQTVACRFREHKHALDAVDFDDQLRMAARLLQSGQAQPEFDYVIVDEVQDTSRIQCDIIQSLWNNETHLVICGDRKQSIYIWRGADPQVMPDLEKAILETGNGKLENLQTSYRSKKPILDVVNALFGLVYEPENYADGDRLEPNPAFQTAGERPCEEVLAPDDGQEEESRQKKVAAEMEAIANRIKLLVNPPSPNWHPAFRYEQGFQPTEKGNGYRYSDVLILLRRTTHQSVLEHALRHAGILYTLGGKGSGLFTRQETRDVSLFLNVVTNPNDAISLIGFLRSPWIGLSDEQIAELAWGENGFSVDHLLANYPTATDVVDRYRALAGTRLASELVRLLIDEKGYDALLAGLPRGPQRLSNLQKVIDWLREHERGARITPAAVARRLAEQIKNPPQVPEAALLDPAQNAVTIMTVHGAKGLTKRVVFLPDTSSQSNRDTAFSRVFFDKDKQPQLGLKISAPDKSSVESPGFREAKAQASDIAALEFKNLLYVAMTRARDLVVTSASVGQNPAGWLEHLEPLIDKGTIPSIPYSALAAAVSKSALPDRVPPTVSHLATALATLPRPTERPALRRVPATRLAREQDELEAEIDNPNFQSRDNAAAIGSLGHAVLEQLALNNWQGSAAEWLDILRDDFGIGKAAAEKLEKRIEQTRELMCEHTSGMQEMRPEFPFVLHDGDVLIDGTIDLLCRSAGGIGIFDYKFTEADDNTVLDAYRGQMSIYGRAAERAYPNTGDPIINLVVVSQNGPRLVQCT